MITSASSEGRSNGTAQAGQSAAASDPRVRETPSSGVAGDADDRAEPGGSPRSHTGPGGVAELLRQEIDCVGAIPFVRFMELALYHPSYGYYAAARGQTGRRGDYYTSVSVGTMFGELLAYQFGRWLAELKADAVCVVEAGAHDGRLALDLLGEWHRARADFMPRLEYWILEPSASLRATQSEVLSRFAPRVRWFRGWSDLPEGGFAGVIFANELLDSFPVHRLGWDQAGKCWFEWGVGLAGGRFVWELLPTSAALSQAPWFGIEDKGGHGRAELMAVLPDGFTVEACPAAAAWWTAAARALRAGHLITFDYGLSAEAFFAPQRREGTLRAYHQHQCVDDLLARPGEQDLTAHVNFSALEAAGVAEGLKTVGLVSQGRFLTAIAEDLSQGGGGPLIWSPARRRQFQTLTHPAHLGQALSVLVQRR